MATKRILIIDDEATIQTVVQFGLNITAGWTVFTASSGLQGIETAQAEQPDVILLDVMMPDMDGIATCSALQVNAHTQHIPIILLTADAHLAEHYPLRALGIQGFIIKPFNSLELPAQIAKILHW